MSVDLSPYRTGEHLPDGLLVSAPPGSQAGLEGGSLGAEDFAPTIAKLLGVELEGVDGQPRPDLMSNDSIAEKDET